MRRIMITGASGMVGRNLCEHPEAQRYELLTPTSAELNLLEFISVSDYLKSNKPDVIFHCAGLVGGIQANINSPVSFLVSNLDMGRNIVMAAQYAGVRTLLNLGSSCMYPRAAQNPLKEESVMTGELEPTNEGYALAKITVARLCEYICREDNSFQYKTLIPCNLYGRHDKFDPKHSHMVPAIIQKMHNAKKNGDDEVVIWGDGTARREFMYSADLADCIWQAVGNFESLPSVMNVGLGEDWSVSDYYQMIAEVVGYKGRFKHDISKPVGMRQKLVDISKQTNWGWSPKYSLKKGLEATYQFYLQECLQ